MASSVYKSAIAGVWKNFSAAPPTLRSAEQEFLQRVGEAQVWYAEKVQDIKDRQIQLAADREAFILEKAEADAAQAEAAEKVAATQSELIQRKVTLDSHEDDLASQGRKLGRHPPCQG